SAEHRRRGADDPRRRDRPGVRGPAGLPAGTSTLTGGQVISLGRRVAGVMGTPELCQRVQEAGEAVGEPAWPMPLPDEIRKGLDSAVADLAQVNTERVGTMLQGGAFLSEFVA